MKHIVYPIIFTLMLALFGNPCAAAQSGGNKDLVLQHIRNATMKLSSGDTTIIIDPMLDNQGAYPGFPGTYRSELRNPLTPLPMPVEEILADVDAVVLTHTHLDHWDEAAQKALPKNIPFYVQNEEDASLVRQQGFTNVRVMKPSDEFGGIKFDRTQCQHGTDAMYADPEAGKALGDVMGVVFTTQDGKKTYLAADTIWFQGVDDAIARHKPDVIILNAGGAAYALDKFKDDPLMIMGKKDVFRATKAAPNADIVAVHMDAVNHMTVDRKDMAEYVREKGIRDRVLIPFDGEKMVFKR